MSRYVLINASQPLSQFLRTMDEKAVLITQPKMFEAHPLGFMIALGATVCLGLMAVLPDFGAGTIWVALLVLIGPVALVVWWLRTSARRLLVTKKRTRYEEGVLTKRTTELDHRDIRDVQVEQGLVDRTMDVGTLKLSSAGQAGVEIQVEDVPKPEYIRNQIYELRDKRNR